LSLISEIANRRLFSTVRERKQLTYDANFSFSALNVMGGWFPGNGHRVEGKAQLALDACKETCAAPQDQSLSPDNVESAKRVVLNRHEGATDNSLLGADHVWHSGGINSLKGLSVTDFTAVVESITAGTCWHSDTWDWTRISFYGYWTNSAPEGSEASDEERSS
jgi:hypothetical protein